MGEGTAYTVSCADKTQTKSSGSVVNMMRGQLRAIVSKQGPRNNMEVKTDLPRWVFEELTSMLRNVAILVKQNSQFYKAEVSLKMTPKDLPTGQ